MATDFPNNPSHGDVFSTFIYDGTVPGWRSNPETASGMPAGSIMAWGSDVAPTNWLICNGSAVSRTTYASLFAAIGVTYGVGDGTTTFNLPDLRGKVPVGKDATQTEFDLLGETGGNKATAKYGDGTTTGYGATYSSSLGAGDTTASNLQPYQVVNYIIKASAGTSAGDSELATRVGATESVNATQNTRLTNLEYNSPNYLINGAFDIWQRGTAFSSAGYSADRWNVVTASGQTVAVSQQTFTPGTAPVAGYEGTYYTRIAWSGTPSGYFWYNQKVEDVRTLAGQTVTLSFWAKASTATSALNSAIELNMGSGGSGGVTLNGSALSLTTSWARYSTTFTLPSMSGKTIGTSSYLDVRLLQGSSTVNGINIDIWGAQLESGSSAQGFRRNANSIQAELAACQRYYWRATADGPYNRFAMGNGYNTTQAVIYVPNPVKMRAVPSSVEINLIAVWDGATLSGTASSASLDSPGTFGTTIFLNGLTGIVANRAYQMLANGSTSAYIGFSSEI